MRSLRDFNIPKIVTDDMPVFMGLIGDLFPALDVPRKRDLSFESFVKQAVLELKLQPEDNFVLKVRSRLSSTQALGCRSPLGSSLLNFVPNLQFCASVKQSSLSTVKRNLAKGVCA